MMNASSSPPPTLIDVLDIVITNGMMLFEPIELVNIMMINKYINNIMDQPNVWYGMSIYKKGLTIIKGDYYNGLAQTRGFFDWKKYLLKHVKEDKDNAKVWVHLCDVIIISIFIKTLSNDKVYNILNDLIITSTCRLRYVTSESQPFNRPGNIVNSIIPGGHIVMELPINNKDNNEVYWSLPPYKTTTMPPLRRRSSLLSRIGAAIVKRSKSIPPILQQQQSTTTIHIHQHHHRHHRRRSSIRDALYNTYHRSETTTTADDDVSNTSSAPPALPRRRTDTSASASSTIRRSSLLTDDDDDGESFIEDDEDREVAVPRCLYACDNHMNGWLVGIDIINQQQQEQEERHWLNINRHDTFNDLSDKIITTLKQQQHRRRHHQALDIIDVVVLAPEGVLPTTDDDIIINSITVEYITKIKAMKLLNDLKWVSSELLKLRIIRPYADQKADDASASTAAAHIAVIWRESISTLINIPTTTRIDNRHNDDDSDESDGDLLMLWDRVNDHNDIRSNNTEQYHHQQQQHLTDIHTNSYSYSDSTSDDEDEEEDARSSSICEDLDYHGSNSSITSFIGNYNSRIKGPGYRLRADIDNEDDDAVSSSSSLSSDNESSSSEDIHPLRHGIRPNTAATSTRSTSLNADKRLLISSRDTRQFEFHPTYDNIILTGHRSGHISIINSDIDECISSIKVDDSPILGLAWLNHTPNTAIYGASPSGNVGYIKYDKSLITAQRTSTFKHLSSISINSTDDYFMTSGFVPTVALFDLTTGKKISMLNDVHSHFINIIRFSNNHPHIFATSSFDHTCKIWDLRQQQQQTPTTTGSSSSTSIFTAYTGCLNVMCTFNKNDTHLLCSGLDDRIIQFDLRFHNNNNTQSSSSLPLLRVDIKALHSRTNYRRSVYLADGCNFVTAGTDENYYRIMSVDDGSDKAAAAASSSLLGVVSLSGLLSHSIINDYNTDNNINNNNCQYNPQGDNRLSPQLTTFNAAAAEQHNNTMSTMLSRIIRNIIVRPPTRSHQDGGMLQQQQPASLPPLATYNNPSPAAAAGGGGGGGIASLDDDLNDRSDAGSIMEDTVVDETAEEEEEEEDQPATTTTVGHPDGESDDNGGDGLAMSSHNNNHHHKREYIQSVRGHPIHSATIGVLLSPYNKIGDSYIALTKLHNNRNLL